MLEPKAQQLKTEIYERVKQYYGLFLQKEKDRIPVAGKKYDEKELMAIIDAALAGVWTEGSFAAKFENRFNEFLGSKHTIVVNSGSSANLLALKTLTSKKLGKRRLKENDEVITVAAGFPTTINPILQCNCLPVFCDIDIGTYNVNISQLKKAVSKKTKVIMLAHTLGNPFNLVEVTKICKQYGIWLIEDCCDALGSKYDGKLIGSFGDLSTFSFYPAHHITMAEGGAVCTNNSLLAKIARSIRDWGRDCWCKTGQDNTCRKRFEWRMGTLPYGYDHKYIFSEIGYNLKNTDLNIAIGLVQIDRLNEFIKIRQSNFNRLKKEFLELEDYFILPQATRNSEPSWFGFLLTLKENCKFTRHELLKFLNDNRIDTRLLFAGNATRQPYFIDNNIKYKIVENLNNTDIVMNNSFWIGVCPLIEDKDIEYIIKKFKMFTNGYNKL